MTYFTTFSIKEILILIAYLTSAFIMILHPNSELATEMDFAIKVVSMRELFVILLKSFT